MWFADAKNPPARRKVYMSSLRGGRAIRTGAIMSMARELLWRKLLKEFVMRIFCSRVGSRGGSLGEDIAVAG